MSWLPATHAGQEAGNNNLKNQAEFSILDGASGNRKDTFAVQFNPASLDYTLSNEFDNQGSAASARQFVKKTSGKLSMTLLFDTTETGADVRAVSANIAHLLEPAGSGERRYAPKVEFSWGSYHFKGVVEQFKETLDFFAPSGVPLRSSISLTLASQEVEFQSSRSPAPPIDKALPPDPVRSSPGLSPQAVANQNGDPRAAREIARQSGAASLRAPAIAGLSVGLNVKAGPDLSAGTRPGDRFGALRQPPAAGPARISIDSARGAMLSPPRLSAADVAPGRGSQLQGGTSLAADVGVGVDLSSELHFGR